MISAYSAIIVMEYLILLAVVSTSFVELITATMNFALRVDWVFLCKTCLGEKPAFSPSRQD
jgi:hypothetical protein